jgi:hypothetical protein
MTADVKAGPKYFVDIEGTEYPWEKETVTTEEVIALGNLPADQGVILVDDDNVERTLAAGEVVVLKPGHRFGKRVRFKRGSR